MSKTDDKIVVKKVLDKYYLSEKTSKYTNSDFLDPYQQKLVEKTFNMMGIRDYSFLGGYRGAERAIVVFCPNVVLLNSLQQETDETGTGTDDTGFCTKFFEVLKITTKGRNAFSHRDYLGSLMGLGIKREKIGDILVKEDFCVIVVLKEIAEFIEYNLIKVGNKTVDITVVDSGELKSFEPKIKEIGTTVASLRIDCIASASFGISRSKIASLIKSQRVYLNWELVSSLSKTVQEEDTISIKGKGRAVLQRTGKLTKKNRIHVVLKKFI
ncbi:YlmH/Sll1252 family protein [Herbivorax sp. ANBcel31]|uniref:YlmH family RNA-binding protein n=1 Tax=Herbivorax sp. ANBcel31 TaxID=3069754 RepID=UPI0027ADA80F|nr:YlmH/Sll1252 family protein [Herbivorax sp. ANBcel31]MDQ2086618.1 YlmH/Sll1252 family protein [Herbivorax sp. ANBcel31]